MMVTGQLAVAAAAAFTGAAVYITVVEQPARLGLAAAPMLAEWKPAYRRGTAMQAPLALVAGLLGLAAGWQSGAAPWFLGAVLMIANWPLTFLLIMPLNRRLTETEPDAAGAETVSGIVRWGRLHRLRSLLGSLGTSAFLWAALAGDAG